MPLRKKKQNSFSGGCDLVFFSSKVDSIFFQCFKKLDSFLPHFLFFRFFHAKKKKDWCPNTDRAQIFFGFVFLRIKKGMRNDLMVAVVATTAKHIYRKKTVDFGAFAKKIGFLNVNRKKRGNKSAK
jgi:hypothetical protein